MSVSFFNEDTKDILGDKDEETLSSLIQIYEGDPWTNRSQEILHGYTYFFRYAKNKSIEDLDKAINICEKAIAEADSTSEHNDATLLIDLAGMLADKFKQSHNIIYMEKAVTILETALSCDDADPVIISNRASSLLALKYQHTLIDEDLNLALIYAAGAEEITPDEHPEIVPLATNLVAALLMRYNLTDSTEDLKQALKLAARVVTASSEPSELLVEKLSLRFEQKRLWYDIKAAIAFRRGLALLEALKHPSSQGGRTFLAFILKDLTWEPILLSGHVADFDTMLFRQLLLERIRNHAISSLNLLVQHSTSQKTRIFDDFWRTCLDYVMANLPLRARGAYPDKPDWFYDLSEVQNEYENNSLNDVDEEAGWCWVVVVLPAVNSSTDLQCIFAKAPLPESNQVEAGARYEVLSSAWETELGDGSIFLDQRPVSVPKVLESALRQLRHRDDPLAFWIDILCLSTKNLKNPSKTMQHIRNIYHHAQTVVVWLGDESETCEQLFKFMSLSTAPLGTEEEIATVVREYQPHFVIGATLDLMAGSWWDRATLLQDLLQGCKTEFHCGRHNSSLQGFHDLFSAWYENIDLAVTEGLAKQYPQLSQLLPQIPCDLVQISPMKVFEGEDQLLRRFEGLCSSIARVFGGRNADLNWIIALAKVGPNLGWILTSMGVRMSEHYVQRRRSEFFANVNGDNNSNSPSVSRSAVDVITPSWEALGRGPPNIALRMVSRHSEDRAREFSRQRRSFAQRHLKAWRETEDFAQRAREAGHLREELLDSDFMKNSSGVFCGLDMPEEESSAEFVRRWAEDMRQSKEEKARVWSERFKDTKRDVLQQLIAIVDEEFPDEGSGTGKGKDKMQPQELARFFSEKVGDETLDVHYWLLFLAILSKRPLLTSSAAFHPLITTADETNFSTETLGEVYTYEPLDFENQEVRVLVLEPSPNTVSDIYGHMVRLPLKTLASLGVIRYPFAALSYVWGKEEATKTIFLHGKRMKVKPNLFLALKCLRDPVVPTLLWIDALCINQKNNEEKSNQVSLMAQIYYNAGHVLMWVGAENHGSGHALLPLYLYDLEQVFKKRGMSEETEKRLHDLECYAMTLEHNVALHDILQRPYWTRVWIVQEVLLAQKATICCGSFVSSWNSVVEISGCNSTGGGFVNLSYTGHEKPLAGQLGEIYAREHYVPEPKKFLDVLTLGRDREATMHHDYIYAFLGIAKVSPDEFMPDYNKAPDIVYKDTFEFIIKQSNDLDVLNLCKRYKNEEKFDESVAIKWPSWLPDWSDKYAEGRLNEMTSMLTSKGHRSYNASAGRVAEFSLSGDRKHLTIRGILFDSVEFVSQDEWPTSAGEDWEVYRQRWSEDGAVSNPYGTAHVQRLALAHTTFLGQASVDELPVFSGTVMAAEDDLISDAEKSLNFTFFRDPQEPPHPKRLLLPAMFSNTALAKTKIDLDSSFEEQCKQAVEAFSETLDEIGKGPTPESLDGPSFNRMIHLTRDIAAISGIKKQCSMFQSRFFVTSLGYIGRGPIPIRQGDLVFYSLRC